MQPMSGVMSPMESRTMRINFSGESVPAFRSSPPMGSTDKSVAGMMFMAKVKRNNR